MDSFGQGIRFVVGLGMVAAGSALFAPAGVFLVSLAGHEATHAPAAPPAVPSWAVNGSNWPPVASEVPFDGPHAARVHRLEYVPPPVPPEPLPPQSPTFTAAGPDLAAGYRPTLQSPPPPLLDGQAPPPLAVGWTARQPEAWAGSLVPQGPQHMAKQASIYIVRDGDDLTGIASRFYGHPAAAAAIWQANRGLLRDPGLLPIGAAIVLPPRAVVAGLGHPTDHMAIEPVAQGQPHVPTAGGVVSHTASWLTGNGAPTGPASPSP